MFKRLLLTLSLIAFSTSLFGAESAGLAGFVNTDETVENNGFEYPKSIWTLYIPGDPSEKANFLFYVAYKKTGNHSSSIIWFDKNGKAIDHCDFTPDKVNKLPFVATKTCGWGGRLPDGGLTIRIYDTFNGNKELISEMFLPAKSAN